ncbi:bifunctional pyr operon transcriptional regulator/uracil phosphoribosyltransferase PyrR [candidate division WOR-3 bacterium]|nr:bifunctional pyr operon transcriptional regulator/uracil phosphoribosyltransferase PyrR [candidate division WOR-3 bacterium]
MGVKFREKRTLMNEEEMQWALQRIAHELIEHNSRLKEICIIGIRKRGDILAKRIAEILGELTSWDIKVGVLDITLYRDDLTTYGPKPIIGSTYFPCNIDNLNVLLVDDVIYTGRTIRAALDEIIDYGRPSAIRLATMVTRSGRELPIMPDYSGTSVNLSEGEEVQVFLSEIDDQDSVKIIEVSTNDE